MGRGVSYGGGQSSLGYLFGSGEAPKPNSTNGSGEAPKPTSTSESGTGTTSEVPRTQNEVANAMETPQKSPSASSPEGVTKEIPAGIPRNNANNYFRADGQNCGNFLTDRPTTKVHAAPVGGSSLDYLFGGSKK